VNGVCIPNRLPAGARPRLPRPHAGGFSEGGGRLCRRQLMRMPQRSESQATKKTGTALDGKRVDRVSLLPWIVLPSALPGCAWVWELIRSQPAARSVGACRNGRAQGIDSPAFCHPVARPVEARQTVSWRWFAWLREVSNQGNWGLLKNVGKPLGAFWGRRQGIFSPSLRLCEDCQVTHNWSQ